MEELILDPITRRHLLSLPGACGERSYSSLLALNGSLDIVSDPKASKLDPIYKTLFPHSDFQDPELFFLLTLSKKSTNTFSAEG